MKRYLSVSRASPRSVRLTSSPLAPARELFLTSPLYPAAGGDYETDLPPAGRITFVAALSPRARLHRLLRSESAAKQRVFVSYGLASIVIIAPHDDDVWHDADQWIGEEAHETWTIENGMVTDSQVSMRPPTESPSVEQLPLAGIPLGLAGQVRQAQTNLAALRPLVAQYTPEMLPLIDSLSQGVHATVSRVSELRSLPSAPEIEVASGFHMERVVELNNALAALRSQVFSGIFPLLTTEYVVAEYSLLGVGTAIRALWRHTSHLAAIASAANLPGRLSAGHTSGGPFDFFKNRTQLDFTVWESCASASSRLPASQPAEPRLHIPYFSGKGGFRETTHAISAPWQALHSSASSKWTLLTICHEYLHSHFRDIFAAMFGPQDLTDEVIERIARSYSIGPTTPQESMWGCYVAALLEWDRVRTVGDWRSPTAVPDIVTGSDVRNLHREHHRWLSEIVVHTLDFHYTYRAEDLDYVESLWRSWSEVPRVANNLGHYVLRTLAGLSSKSDPSWSGPRAFVDACTRMASSLRLMPAPPIPHVDEMLQLLDMGAQQDEGAEQLQSEFIAARYVAQFARFFLYDENYHADLIADTSTVAPTQPDDTDDEELDRSDYPFGFFQYPPAPIQSPQRFLLEHLGRSDESIGRLALEQRSLWQHLVLVEGSNGTPHT